MLSTAKNLKNRFLLTLDRRQNATKIYVMKIALANFVTTEKKI